MLQNSSLHSDYEFPDNSDHLTLYCAKWILKTNETRKLTRSAMVGIVNVTADLIREILSSVKAQLLSTLRKSEVDPTTSIMKVFSDDNKSLQPFSTLMTFQQQQKYYRENFNLIVSTMIILITKN